MCSNGLSFSSTTSLQCKSLLFLFNKNITVFAAKRYFLVVCPTFFHIFEVKELCGVKRHCWCRAGPVLCCGGEGATLSLVGHPSSDSIMIKMPYAVDVLN